MPRGIIKQGSERRLPAVSVHGGGNRWSAREVGVAGGRDERGGGGGNPNRERSAGGG
jgi:hypothetical protein